MKNRFVVQWDKEDCADLGFIKVDLLGLGMLNALEKAIPLLEQTENIKLDYAHIPKNDPRVYRQLQKADTVGVFQLESRAQMSMLPRLKPKNFYDLVVEIALIRPGPIVGKMVHPYLKRRSAAEAIRYPHPKLEPILKRTLGIPIFQEQLLKIAMAIADFSGGEAEELRRAMGFKRSETRMSDIISKLKSGMTRNNIPVETQNELIQYIQSFALYGFPESHSASFALIAYASAYLKVYYPGVFLCALLNAWPLGFYSPATLVKDAQRHNVKVFPIDISRSSWECTMPQKNTVRLGLRFLNQLRRSTGQSILSARSEAPFKNLNDLCIRTTVNKTERLSLAESGALECFGHSRRNSLWQINRFHPSNHDLFSNLSKPLSNSPLKEMDTLENILADYQHVGLSIKSHPMALFRPHLSSSMVTSLKLAQCPNHSLIETAGIVTVRQRPSNAKGFFFITLEDEFGFINLVLEPNFFKKNRVLATQCAALKVLGNIQQAEGVTHIRCKSLTPIHLQERRK